MRQLERSRSGKLNFLNYQRSNRKMAIGAIDKTTTRELTKTLQRKEKRSQHKAEPSTSGAATLASFSESDSTSTTDDNSDFEDKTDKNPRRTNLLRLPSVALACDRSRVSDRTAASIVSATLQDTGIISSKDASEIVDPSKFRRKKKRET